MLNLTFEYHLLLVKLLALQKNYIELKVKIQKHNKNNFDLNTNHKTKFDLQKPYICSIAISTIIRCKNSAFKNTNLKTFDLKISPIDRTITFFPPTTYGAKI